MSVTIELSCDGCDATTQGTTSVKPTSTPVWGGDMWRRDEPNIAPAVPAGWVAFDPYTRCTYCPSCWTEIEADPATTEETR